MNSKNNFKFDDISINIKERVINELYDKIDVKDYRFLLIKNSDNIIDIKNSKYYVSANYGGIPSFLIFLKIDDEFHCYLIDRRSISFDRSYLSRNNNYNLNNVRMTKVNISVDIKLYDGTIFDCCLIDRVNNKNVSNNKINYFKNNDNNRKLQIIITDVFYLCNKNLLSYNYKNKIFNLTLFLKNNYISNVKDNIELNITPVYELNQIKELFTHYHKHFGNILNIKGIVLYPNKSSVKLIYIYNQDDNSVKEELNDIQKEIIKRETKLDINNNLNLENIKKNIKFELSDISNNENIILNFEIIKNDKIPDIYYLYGLYSINNKIYKKKSGIAYIPDYNTTLKCKNMFLDKNKVIIECLFYPEKSKWIPIKVSEIQKIHIINNDKRLKIIEENIIDND
jgi:hypothetical protein